VNADGGFSQSQRREWVLVETVFGFVEREAGNCKPTSRLGLMPFDGREGRRHEGDDEER
jgi:hypothetical protein